MFSLYVVNEQHEESKDGLGKKITIEANKCFKVLILIILVNNL